MKTAVIDIGSNSVRYALFTPATVVAAKKLNSTVLADGLFFSGKLSDEAMARTINAVAAFCREAREQNADDIYIFATEAVRAARNGKAFAEAVEKACGVTVDVIEGAVEAQIGFLGATVPSDEQTAVFDMGGASCEVILGKNGRISYAQSFPIGCVRLRDGAGKDKQKAERMVAAALPSFLPPAAVAVGIGGTATALGGMLHCPKCYDPAVTHGSFVPLSFLQHAADLFFQGADMQTLYPSLSPARARVIGYGALAALRILELLSLDGFTVSERDNMEGYYELHRKK